MEIRNGKLHLSQDDIENIIAQRIKEIQDKLDESYYKIKNGEIAPHNLPITMLEEKDYKSTPFDGSYEEFTMAPALYSYLKVTDFGGARVVPFSTQGSNFGSFYKDFAEMAKNAQILQSENFNNIDEKYKEQVSNKINAWLNKLSK